MFTPTITDGIVAAAALGLCYRLCKRWTALPLPPGPKGLPLIGNILDMPKSYARKTFAQWGNIYGNPELPGDHTQLYNPWALRRDHVRDPHGPAFRDP